MIFGPSLTQVQESESEEVMLVLAGKNRAKCAQCAPGQMCLLFEEPSTPRCRQLLLDLLTTSLTTGLLLQNLITKAGVAKLSFLSALAVGPGPPAHKQMN